MNVALSGLSLKALAGLVLGFISVSVQGQTESSAPRPDFDPAPVDTTVCEGETAVFKAGSHYIHSGESFFGVAD